MVKKIIFTFRDKNLEILHDISEEGGFDDLADTLNEALKILRCLQSHAKEGYHTVMVVDPKTGDSRELFIEHLHELGTQQKLLPAPKPESEP